MAQAEPLKVVPEKFSAQGNQVARFLVIALGDEVVNPGSITVEGLPEDFSWTLQCTGKKGDKCSGVAGKDDLPVFMLNISIPPSAAEGIFPFTLQNHDSADPSVTPLSLDIVKNMHFVHPGIMLSDNMLSQMRAHLQSSDSVWDRAYQQVLKSKSGSLSYQPTAHGEVNADNQTAEDLRNDAIAAYTQALLWVITGNSRYADNTINIMNAWSEKQNSDFTGNNKFNLAAWVGDVWPRAAEIIRYTYKDPSGNAVWQKQDIQRFSMMLNKHYIDFINNGFFTSGQYGGNLIASQAAALINIGVFNNDVITYLSGIEKWRRMLPAYIYMREDGAIPAPPVFWRNNYIDRASLLGSKGYWYGQDLTSAALDEGGFSQETCRDLGHVLWGFSALANGAQTARIQGTDLDTETTLGTVNTARLSSGLEFNIAFLNNAISQQAFISPNVILAPEGLCNGSVNIGSSVGKGEVLFNDIVTRRGLSLPQTARYLEAQRPSGAGYFMVWETLTHYLNP